MNPESIPSFIFGRALTLKLCTAQENIRTNFILCRCLNIQKYQSNDGTHLQDATFAQNLSALYTEYLFLALIYHGVLMGIVFVLLAWSFGFFV